MKPKLPFVSFARWTIFIFASLVVMSKIEHKVSLAVGSHLSSEYAQWVADLHKSADAIKAKDPDGWRYVTSRVGFSIYILYGITVAIISGFIVWWRKDSRGVPNMMEDNLPLSN
jgi:cytochrome b subunit of formate dehydrogenase